MFRPKSLHRKSWSNHSSNPLSKIILDVNLAQLWGDSFWSDSYFIATTGTTVIEKVREYIDSQRSDEHKRKYEKTGRYSKKKSSDILSPPPAIHPQPTVKWKLSD